MKKISYIRICLLLFLLLPPCVVKGQNQTYYQYQTDDAQLVFFDKNLSRYIPHMIRMYQNGKALHEQIWTTDSLYKPEAPLMLLTDWEDDGNGGATDTDWHGSPVHVLLHQPVDRTLPSAFRT